MPTALARLGPPSATRRKGERTAERILDAAEILFSERGFAGTTLRDVALRVGLRIPSLYNHFASKESLYSAVLERGIGPVLAVLSEFVEEGSEAFEIVEHRVIDERMASDHRPILIVLRLW